MDKNVLNGNIIDIMVKHDDIDLQNASQKFLKDLEDQYDEYRNNFSKVKNTFEVEKQKKIYFIPEALSVLSPLTIIDAPWGSGKTYFIESFVKNFANEKIESDKFKNIIVLDVYRYSTYDNIPYQIMIELFDIMIDQLETNIEKNQILKNKAKTSFKFIYNKIAVPLVKSKTEIELPKWESEPKIEDLLEEINKKIEHTIIIFDNIERIGPNSWEILKAIFKISQLDKIVFVLPMNSKMLDGNNSISNNEHSIEKFINIKHFNLVQDYKSILKNLGFNDLEQEIINDLLIQEIDGKKLSIRQLEKMVVYNKIIKLDNSFEIINKFETKIWKLLKNTENNFKNLINTEYKILIQELIKKNKEINSEIFHWLKHFNIKANPNFIILKPTHTLENTIINQNGYFYFEENSLERVINLEYVMMDLLKKYDETEDEIEKINYKLTLEANELIKKIKTITDPYQNNILKLEREKIVDQINKNPKLLYLEGTYLKKINKELLEKIASEKEEMIHLFCSKSKKHNLIWYAAVSINKINLSDNKFIDIFWEKMISILKNIKNNFELETSNEVIVYDDNEE